MFYYSLPLLRNETDLDPALLSIKLVCSFLVVIQFTRNSRLTRKGRKPGLGLEAADLEVAVRRTFFLQSFGVEFS